MSTIEDTPARREGCLKHNPGRKGKGKRSRFLLFKRAP